MSSMSLTVDADKLQQAILKSPDALERNLEQAINRILQEMARSAKRNAPKAFSQLVNSILPKKLSPLEGVVAPGVNYAEAVEQGTGIYGPRGIATGKFAPIKNILDWVKVTGIQPNNPNQTQENVAWLISRKIATTGTKPQPYLQPAFDDNKTRAEQRISKAIDKAINEAGG